MGSHDFSPLVRQGIKNLFQAYVSDLGDGMGEGQAGWRTSTELGLAESAARYLHNDGVVQKDAKSRIRLNFQGAAAHNKLQRVFPAECAQLEYVLSAPEDQARLVMSRELLQKVVTFCESEPLHWSYVCAAGCSKMLESSGLPAVIDDILKEGFSPRDWAAQTRACSCVLALSLAAKVAPVMTFSGMVETLRRHGFTDDSMQVGPPSADDVEKVKRVLKWADIDRQLTERSVRTLGLLWFSFSFLTHANVFPCSVEKVTQAYDSIWGSTERLLKEERVGLLSELESIVERCEEAGVSWAAEIIRIPEVV